MRTLIAAPATALLVLGLMLPATSASAKVKVGDTKPTELSVARGAAEQIVTVSEPGATFLKLHFTDVQLDEGGQIVVSNPGGNSRVTVKAEDVDSGEGWAHSIPGDTAVVTVVPLGAGAFTVDRYAYGDPALAEESVYGNDDRLDRECFPGSEVYNWANSVFRILFVDDGGGSFVCTGSLVSGQNHALTNNHCMNTESEVDSVEAWFNYERTTCGGSTDKARTTVGSSANTLVRTNAGLDFTLFTLAGNPAATYGYLPLNGENLANVLDSQNDDPLYLPQHPGGRQKVIHALHAGADNERCWVRVGDWSEPGYTAGASIQHACDTEGGSSGSPILNDSGQIVALHHTGYAAFATRGCPTAVSSDSITMCASDVTQCDCNGGIEMENIYPLISGDLPADRGGSGGGSGWVWYKVQEAWRYQSGNSHRMWLNFNGTGTTAWVDTGAQPTLGEMFVEGASSSHWLGLFWTGSTAWSNARLWFN